MSRHPPFAEVQASRPRFEVDTFAKTKTYDPEWKPGQGLSDHPGSERCAAGAQGKIPFKVVQPGVTETESRMIYKILIGAVAPRPVAMVGTCAEDGTPNLAPISFYQVVCHNPPLLMISFGGPGYSRKDSEVNIKRSQEFCISSSNEPFAEALNYASVDAPHGTSEFAITGLTPVIGRSVKAPRVGEAPVSFKLKVHSITEFHTDSGERGGCMVIGRVQLMYIREDVIEEDGAIDPAKTYPVSRFGGLLYGRSTRGYELERPSYEKVKDEKAFKEATSKEARTAVPGAAGSRDPVAQHYP
ncbi:unnamed protein product [Sympodiomycopsis kandeliae]